MTPPTPVASLQMYWMPEIADTVDAWWQGLRRHLIAHGVDDAPAALTVADDIHAVWHDPGLVLSQTCGGPLITELGGAVRVVGTPVYGAPLNDGMNYRSAVIVHRDNPAAGLAGLEGARVAINGRASYSGYHALCGLLAGLATSVEDFFAETLVSGGHLESLRAVAEGAADCAAIDSVTYALAARYRPGLVETTRILATTPAVPGLPYITRGDAPDARLESLRRGVEAAVADVALAGVRRTLLLEGFRRTDAEDYVHALFGWNRTKSL